MNDWTKKSHDLLVSSEITRNDISTAVTKNLESNEILLREGADEFFNILQENKIPVLIFSAGIGDVVEEVLKQGLIPNIVPIKPEAISINNNLVNNKKLLPNNVHVVSNRIIFDGDKAFNKVTGFEEPIFHVYNKKGTSIRETTFMRTDDIKNRQNIILLGDSLGDIYMSDGIFHNPTSTIKIGFLNDHFDRLPAYIENYDIVILDDPGLDIPISILKNIVGEGRKNNLIETLN